MEKALLTKASGAIIRVGEGRGFLIENKPWPHSVITAAHCLPHLPPAHPASFAHDRTYANVLGPVGGELTLWAECVFVDPIADLAVLVAPDNQAFYEENEAYETFMEHRPTLRIGPLVQACPVWLLTMAGQWQQCAVEPGRPPLGYKLSRAVTLVDATEGNSAGCSGSPILIADGRAIGVVSVGTVTTNSAGERTVERKQHGQPMLATDLPAWLVAEYSDVTY